MSFRIGEKVVCIDDSMRVCYRKSGWFERWRSWIKLAHNLNRGDIYTICGFQTYQGTSGDSVVCVLVAEAWHFEFREIGFPAFQFRKLVTRKTDIAIFNKLLIPSREREGTRA